MTTATSTSDGKDVVDCTSGGNGHGGIEIQVSSRHLTLHSLFFEEKLSSKDKTATSDGMVLVPMEVEDVDSLTVVPMEVEDVDALMVVLNVLHCRTSKVPRLVGLQMLCMIAGLVYKYGCLEAVEVFSSIWIDNLKEKLPFWCREDKWMDNKLSLWCREDTWMDNLKETLPWCYSEDLARWIFVSWVFHYEYTFQRMTLIAMRYSAGPIQHYGLPIPKPLLRGFFLNNSQKT